MENVVKYRFVLKFNSDIGRVVRLSIPRACVDKTAAEVETYMDAIIDAGVVSVTERGIPESIKSAKRVRTEREVIVGS